MRVTLLALALMFSLQAAAQNVATAAVFETQTAIIPRTQQAVSFAAVKEAKPRIFDRKFFIMAGIATAATMLDVTTTSHCMSTYPDCQEGNPLIGSHPSQAKLYGVSFSMLGGQLLASAWMRHKAPNGKLWMVPPIIATAGHGLAAALNVRTMHNLSNSR